MAMTSRITEPYRNYRFLVEIGSFSCLAFRRVSGLKSTTDVVEWREGGDAPNPRTFPGITKHDPITLERGLCDDSDAWNWIKTVTQVSKGGGSANLRRNISIILLDTAGNEVKRWAVYGAWPSEYSVSDLDAGANDIMIESLTIQHNGWEVV